MNASTWILLAVSLSSFLIAIDGWVHRREMREQEFDYRADGQPSLKVQVESLRAELQRTIADTEKLRLERASVLANELAGVHASLLSLHAKASDNGTEMQKTFARMNERVILLESKMEAIVGILDRRRH